MKCNKLQMYFQYGYVLAQRTCAMNNQTPVIYHNVSNNDIRVACVKCGSPAQFNDLLSSMLRLLFIPSVKYLQLV